MNRKLSFSQKLSRFRTRMREPEWRKYGQVLLLGKFTGIALLLLGALILNPGLMGLSAFAADPVLKGNDIVNPINTVWTLVAAFLVFGMQAGFTQKDNEVRQQFRPFLRPVSIKCAIRQTLKFFRLCLIVCSPKPLPSKGTCRIEWTRPGPSCLQTILLQVAIDRIKETGNLQ